jgi:hypothetical protein
MGLMHMVSLGYNFQCYVPEIGSSSLLYQVELISIVLSFSLEVIFIDIRGMI